ncbi:MAG: hypothetical protein MJ159_00100 [Treponemataceae bacterium]|nr:hypothetical protein [Treponemataceae bacterium]
MNAIDLSEYLAPIIKVCPLWKNEILHATVIANPAAGGFTRKKIALEHESVLKAKSEAAAKKEQSCKAFSINVYETERAGATASFIQKFVKEASMPENLDTKYLIVTAGGDGTSLEVQTALVRIAFDLGGEYENIIKNRITMLRLPFGTGNDGSDGWSLEESLELLEENTHFSCQRAVKVDCRQGSEIPDFEYSHNDESLSANPPWYAFNIASIGIDAFITHMTNRTKSHLPGNFYKYWIDLACLFYGLKYKSGMAEIRAYDKNGAVIETLKTGIVFCLLGVSGHRTYGSHQKILPDDRNVCIAKKMSLMTKMLLKEKFKSGKHINHKLAFLCSAEKLEVEYDQPILVQMDGEVHLVCKENFPLTFERTESVIRIIEKDTAPYYKGAERVN